ncbi:MAG: type II CRISPR RNA-guided endonuclease Cas9, partial [Prevotella pallens]|nr:type II CRISPR RNA-guided endonuclease Cas9 [Prevotella pallens]
TEYEADGETPKYDKEGKIKRSFKSPEKGDWQLIKTRTEKFIESSNKTVGTFIYDHLLKEPFDKIRGKYIRTIERKYYKNELYKILCEQAKYHKELDSLDTLNACAKELYKNNQQHQEYLLKKDMKYLLLDDLIFYQRPLKSKKSLIADCPYEVYKYNYKQTGKKEQKKIKCIAKSNPYYQEFRLWQFISNIHLFNVTDGKDVTSEYLKTKEDYVRLFTYLNDRKEIKQETLLKGFLKLKKETIGSEKIYPIRWNYIEDANKSYPCNTTRHELLLAFNRAGIQRELLNVEGREYRLWHLLYSIESKDKTESALRKLKSNKAFSDLNIDDAFVNSFLKIKPFKKEYGAYSEKAIKKLLAVMRRGSLWKEADICEATKQNIAKILQNDIDEKLKKKIEAAVSSFNKLSDFQGLPTWLACYVVYGRHSEAAQIQCWQSPEDLKTYINKFKQHSLRNPIVEQCLLETLRTVYDIWKDAGQIDEIHIELGRNMKSTAEQRARKTNEFLRNENTNLRIKNLLMELKNDDKIENVRPYSPSQQEILRIYEEGALQELSKEDEMYEDISKISKMAQPSPTELSRYKLWLEQKYRSPYTGRVIPLSKLFTTAYQIEHIIPQSRYFDDSFNNKVICESEVNSLKDNMLGYEFIKECGGQKVHCTLLDGNVEIFTEEEYKTFVTKHYVGNPRKKDNLLLEDIPQEFSARQLNDSRYISKMVQTVLSNIVRTKDEQEAISKFVVSCNGMITDRLKKDWGLNDVWNTIVYPRFKRLNEKTKTNAFGHWENKNGEKVFQTTVPLELQNGFSKKRIDHRHHAMDALVIACASRNIVNYLNNESANNPEKREYLRKQLCNEKRKIKKPWNTFTQDAREALADIVVS